MLFCALFLIFFSFEANASVLPPKSAPADFRRLFETGIRPNDNTFFYFTGYGKNSDEAADEAQIKIQNKITGMRPIVNTPKFDFKSFNDYTKKSSFWGIYRMSKKEIKQHREKIVPFKILAKEIIPAENDDEKPKVVFLKGASVYYKAKNGTLTLLGKTPLSLEMFAGRERFVLKLNDYYDTEAKVCHIKAQQVCGFVMKPLPKKEDNALISLLILIVFVWMNKKFGKKRG